MNTLQTIKQVCKSHFLTLEIFSNYVRSGVDRKKRIHEAMVELYYSHGISISKMLRVLPENLNFNRALLSRMLHGNDILKVPRNYTLEENQLILRQIKTKTYEQIAEMLGRTPYAVRLQASKLGVNYQKSRPELYKQLRRRNLKPFMQKNGLSNARTLANPAHNG